jgi:integrase/recombinase XerD
MSLFVPLLEFNHLEMKAKALATCEVSGGAKTEKRWRQDPQLMTFLRSL